ncbi:hypothetical protein RUM43_007845 [Polyplax serrata]|uniref:Uncharacterized protein n=1 Tax=Polyplax serrata TaxID=468196 RepID=A0AAN8S841_POLSC
MYSMNQILRRAPSICRTSLRGIGTSESNCNIANIRKKQIEFQVEDGVPVYRKGSPINRFLNFTAYGLTLAGMVLSGRAIYMLYTKK